jgi:hypothetical protein
VTGQDADVGQTFSQELRAYGVRPEQLIELSQATPRSLTYVDLQRGDESWRVPAVLEHERVPRVFVFDARDEVEQTVVDGWCQRVLLRGDPAWTAILRPGRIDVLSFQITGASVSRATEASLTKGEPGLARFVRDVRSGAADLPRREYLKNLLSQSMKQAVSLGVVNQADAVSLVGWGLFWRFLVDRELLVGLDPHHVADGAETWTDCLATKGRALTTLKWLNDTFNGHLLPFHVPPKDYAPEVFNKVLGNIAAGATATGQLRLPTDWNEIDFSHVPVGLLSEVYEAFATGLDADEADAQSIHYTPRHIADFVVAETLEAVKTDQPRVLDPAAGAGVFLIAAFRELVQREWTRTGKRPARKDIRRILSTQLTAFDIDERALRLTQLGLYLTALELDPQPTPISDLKFDELKDVFVHLDAKKDGSLGPVNEKFRSQFDVVIGNPPWTAPSKGLIAKKRWVKATGDTVKARLGDGAASFDLPDANPDLPFLWRAGEWAKPSGQISLVMHARWLFGLSKRSFGMRHDVFTAFNVAGVLNGSALRLTAVWPNVDAPFCIVFARNESAPPNGAFRFVSPFVEDDDTKRQTVLRIDWGDAQHVLHEDVRETPWSLKSRFRGDELARRALHTVMRVGVPLGDYLKQLNQGLRFRNGYQVGGAVGKQRPAKALHGLPDLKGHDADTFLLDASKLPVFNRKTLLFPRDRAIYEPPLLLVRQTIPADRLSPRSIRSEIAIAYHESFHGLSLAGIAHGEEHAKFLQILLQSQLGTFAALVTDGRYGVERDTIYLESLNTIPVVPLDRLTAEQRDELRRLSKALEKGLDDALFAEINAFVFDLYGLLNIERDAITDTLDTRGPSTASVARSVASPDDGERERFVATLKSSLDDVLQASRLQSTVEEVEAGGLPWRVLSVSSRPVPATPVPMEAILQAADESGASLVLVPVNKSHVFVGLPDRYRYWTRTQARLLAADLLGGPLGDV